MSTSPEKIAESSGTTDAIKSNQRSTDAALLPLRRWPAVTILVLMVLLRLLPRLFESPPLPVMMVAFIGPPLAGFLLLPWWLFASRAAKREKLLGLAGLVIIAGVSIALLHPSMWGMPMFMYQLPVGLAAFAVPLMLLARRSSVRVPAALVGAAIGIGCWDLLRFDGVTGAFAAEFSSRWAPTSEDQYLDVLATSGKSKNVEPAGAAGDQETLISGTDAEWPGFRGGSRTNVISDIALAENWVQNAPKLIWKTLIGPGWSSFAVAGQRLFTQEQRGESAAVVCLDAASGTILWSFEYPARFSEPAAGVGPRATPTIGENALYCVGADGAVMCLRPATGELIWQRDLRQDAEREPPTWGWSSSPLVVDSSVIVHAGGHGDRGLIAYDAAAGEILWTAPSGDHTYSSAHLAEFEDVEGVLMVSNDGLQFLDPRDGRTIWEHAWQSENYRVLQPLVSGNAVLIAGSLGDGTRRVSIGKSGEEWRVTEDWTTQSMKPSYNDFVLYEGNVYGFDGSIFASINFETGQKNWKGGRYGNGQVLLLNKAGQLLLTSEKGEIVLLKAHPEKWTELAKVPGIAGKTWNHPVLIADRLYLRNGQEAACYTLPVTVH